MRPPKAVTANHSLRRSFHALASPFLSVNVSRFFSTCSSTPTNKSKYLGLLSSCKDLRPLLQIHAQVIVSGLKEDTSTLTHLMNAYSFLHKCDVSRSVFDSVPNPGVILCNTMIRVYVQSKRYREALRIYGLMKKEGLRPDKYTFNFAVKACTGALDLREGVLVHREIARRKLESDVFIGTSLVDMYCKLGELRFARQLFDRLPNKDVVACNAMIAGFSQGSDPGEALGFFRRIQSWGLGINSVSLLNLVPAVSGLGDLDSCRSIHGYVVRRDFGTAVFNGLIDMYSKCGDVTVARRVFDSMKSRDDISWGTMMAGYVFNRCFLEVLDLFDCLRHENLKMNEVSIISALLAASELRDLERGKEIHRSARNDGIDSHVRVATPIMTMYAKCREIGKAKELFEKLQGKDFIARSTLLSAFVQSGYSEEALDLFRDTQANNLLTDGVTLSSVLSACADLSQIKLGKSIHCYAVKAYIDCDISAGTALVSMYAKCGFFTPALIVFNRLQSKDIVTWNALINTYAQIGEPYRAMEMFHKLQLSGTEPDAVTMVGLIQACVLLNDHHQGGCIHGQIIKTGLECENRIKNSLVGMYARCDSISSADFLFNRTQLIKDVVSWNVLISGYAQSGHPKEAIAAFRQMKLENEKPNSVTFVSVLPAVSCLSALREGMALHAYITKIGFLSNTSVGNGLIDMYAKCGRLEFSEYCFDEMKHKDTVSWNTMLAGYSVHGRGDCAVSLFSRMQESHVELDCLSFIGVLSACRHAGLVTEGREIFHSMHEKYLLEPNLEHYACIVDLLGRAELFDEAMSLISTMPMQPDAGVWGALLGACRMHSNVGLGEVALDHLIKLEPENPTNYVVLSDIYAQSGRLHDASETRSKIKDSGLKKTPGCSWFKIEDGLCAFS